MSVVSSVDSDRHLHHIPALDGLRAIAVLSVIGYHFGMPGLDGGFLGVDLFFVLSGFLITHGLLAEHDRTGTISLRGFWARRVRRLTPAILLMVMVVTIWGASTLDRFALRTLRDDIFATLGYVANWRFILSDQSYFAAYGDASPLRHMWSLAIEEQFYLVWPLLVLGALALTRGRRHALVALSTAMIAVSTALMIMLHDANNPSRAYYGTDTRLAQLVIGALVAVAHLHEPVARARRRTPLHSVTGSAALVVIVVAFAVVDDTDAYMYRGGFLAFSLLTVVLIWAVLGSPNSILGNALSLRPVVRIGLISYGLYVWHWPMQIMLSPDATALDGLALGMLRLGATFAAAIVSFMLVEQPVRRMQGWASTLRGGRALLALPMTMIAVLCTVVVTTNTSSALPDYLNTTTAEVIDSGTVPQETSTDALQIVLTGDSLAHSLTRAMEAQTSALGVSFASRSLPGCSMTRGFPVDGNGVPFKEGDACAPVHEEFIRVTATSYVSRATVWIASWDAYDRLVDGVSYRVGTDEWWTKMTELVDETADVLASQGAHLFFVSLAPVAADNETEHKDTAFDERIATYNQLLRDYALNNPDRATFIDLAARVCPSRLTSSCPAVVEGIALRPKDGVHFDGAGARWASRIILNEVTTYFDWR